MTKLRAFFDRIRSFPRKRESNGQEGGACGSGPPLLRGRAEKRYRFASSKLCAILGAVAAFVLAAATPLKAQAPGPLPQGEGRDLVAVACTQCHPLTPILNMRLGQGGWRNHVTNMVLRGAQLTAPEAETVIRYLTASFGPSAALGGGSIVLPNGPGKELVETRCAVCHDLERVATVKRERRSWAPLVADMVMRGAPVSPEEAQTIVAYLTAQFGS